MQFTRGGGQTVPGEEKVAEADRCSRLSQSQKDNNSCNQPIKDGSHSSAVCAASVHVEARR